MTNGDTYQIAGGWQTNLDSTSIPIVVGSPHLVPLQATNVRTRTSFSGVVGSIPIPNVPTADQPIWTLRVFMADDGGGFTDNPWVRIREMFFFGSHGTRTIVGPASGAMMWYTDQLVECDVTNGDVTYTCLPFSQIPNRTFWLSRFDSGSSSNAMTVHTASSGDIFLDNGLSSHTYTAQGDHCYFRVHG